MRRSQLVKVALSVSGVRGLYHLASLYGVTHLGKTVIVSDEPVTLRLAPQRDIAPSLASSAEPSGTIIWQPQRSPVGPMSIVEGRVRGTWAFATKSSSLSGQGWIRIQLKPGGAPEEKVSRDEWQRFRVPEQFKRAVAAIVKLGTTVVVTADTLNNGATGSPVTLLEGQESYLETAVEAVHMLAHFGGPES